MELTIELIALLFFVGLCAGWVDTLAGGGGLITLPALLLTGLPPAAALATNKLQSSFGTFTASVFFIKSKQINLRENLKPVLYIAFGSSLGTATALSIDASILIGFIPLALITIGIYFLFFAQNLDATRKARQSKCNYTHYTAPALGFYDGVLGPGTGSFFSTSLVVLRGLPLTIATAHAKLYNFTSNVSSLGYFILFGDIVWSVGASMIIGQSLGAYLGARTAVKNGAKIIRPLTICICFAMSARLFYQILTT